MGRVAKSVGDDALKEYRRKRDPQRSDEPPGQDSGETRGKRFVFQRHVATTVHFDFRLEIGGVLVSWAVPKGPSTDPRDKRLATRTEDHPREYADFEGRISPDQYGAGTVIVWDTGDYENLTERGGEVVDAACALREGHIKVWLYGTKLAGAYALTRTRMRGGEQNWLLVKVQDEKADARRAPARTETRSVLSGRSNAEIDQEAG